MRMLPVVVLVGAVAFGSYVSAQDKPVVVSTPKPRYTAEAMRKKISGENPVTCRLADATEHPLATIIAFGGKRYRCATVLNENLRPVGAAWTPVEE